MLGLTVVVVVASVIVLAMCLWYVPRDRSFRRGYQGLAALSLNSLVQAGGTAIGLSLPVTVVTCILLVLIAGVLLHQQARNARLQSRP